MVCLSFLMAIHSPSICGVTLRDGRPLAMGCNPTGNFGRCSPTKTPEPSRCHDIIHFRVLSQHLGAVHGRDQNGLRGKSIRASSGPWPELKHGAGVPADVPAINCGLSIA